MQHLPEKDKEEVAFFRSHHLERICELDVEQMRGRPERSKKLLEGLEYDFLRSGGTSPDIQYFYIGKIGAQFDGGKRKNARMEKMGAE